MELISKIIISLLSLIFVLIIAILFLKSAGANGNHFTDEESFRNASVKAIEEIKDEAGMAGKVTLVIKKLRRGSAESKRLPFKGDIIAVDYEKLRGANEVELKGLFAHELMHLRDYGERSWLSMIVLGVKYSFSESYRKELERQTDILAVKEGYGKELIAFKKFKQRTASEKELARYNKLYLSIEEVGELMENS